MYDRRRAGWLALTFGPLGSHKFYLGKWAQGCLYFVVSCATIWYAFDVCLGAYRDYLVLQTGGEDVGLLELSAVYRRAVEGMLFLTATSLCACVEGIAYLCMNDEQFARWVGCDGN